MCVCFEQRHLSSGVGDRWFIPLSILESVALRDLKLIQRRAQGAVPPGFERRRLAAAPFLRVDQRRGGGSGEWYSTSKGAPGRSGAFGANPHIVGLPAGEGSYLPQRVG